MRSITLSAGQIIAGQLSNAAYVPFAEYQNGTAPDLPDGWAAVKTVGVLSSDMNNEVVVFVNSIENQAVVAFKGSNNTENFTSDLTDSERFFSAYASILPVANAALKRVRKLDPAYANYQITTDGHSLGGGMAQSFSVQNDLSGFGQNSLPIAQGSIDADENFSDQLDTWNSDGNTFGEVNAAGDIATLYYSTLQGQLYLDQNPTTFATPYAAIELEAAELATAGPLEAAFGAGIAAYAGIQAHSLTGLIAIEQENLSNPDGDQPLGITEPNASSIVSG